MSLISADMTLAQAFRLVAEQHPGREALVSGSTRANYGQTSQRVEALARGMRDLGVAQGDRVATLLYPCPEFIYTLFALARLGGVIVPIDPRSRRLQLTRILSEAEPTAIVVSSQVGEETVEVIRDWGAGPPGDRHIVFAERNETGEPCLGDLESAATRSSLASPDAALDDLAALLYTSGTTGVPKGAMHSHRSLIAPVVASLRLRQMWIQPPSPRTMGRWAKVLGRYGSRLLRSVGRPQTFLSTAGCHNITGLEAILQALLMGDRLIMMPRFHPIEALRLVEKERVTILIAVPMALSVMVRLNDFDRFDLSSLLICGTGSAPCPGKLARQIQERFQCALHIGFGATELAGGISATSLVDSARIQAETVGQPMPGMEIRIVDEQRREVPAGQVGELACRSDSVMMGYYQSPGRTARVLDEEGWYYTGDLVMIDEQGYLHVMGRKDDMIIRGGQNIYPVEIESYLTTHPAIQEAAVVGVPSSAGGQRVLAWLVLEDRATLTAPQVLQYCREELEAYKIPERVEFVPQLPRSADGKVQKYKLKESPPQRVEIDA